MNRGTKYLFKQEKEDYYSRAEAAIFLSNNFIEYESNGYRNKTLSIE